MKYLATHESKARGSVGFPFEIYHLIKSHPRYEMPFHWHNEYELIRVLEGEFILNVNEQVFHLKKGDIALIVDGAIHGGYAKEAIYECIVFDYINICQKNYAEFSKSLALFEKLEHQVLIISDGSNLTPLGNQIFTLFDSTHMDYAIKLQILGCVFQFMGQILATITKTSMAESTQKSNKNIYRMKKVLSYIKQNYQDNITLEMLSQKANLNAKYLCHLFKQLTGRTPIDYLIYYRIECACEQLLLTDIQITDIALSCGFNDISYFIKKFQQLKGTSPSKYRKSLQR